MDAYAAMPQEEAQPAGVAKLAKLLQANNIAEKLPDAKLTEIGQRAIREYDIDKKSREPWEARIKAAMDLAMLVAEQKDYPFAKASNIKYPLLTTAALQFNARAYPAIVKGNRVAKCQVWGNDPHGMKAARGDRVAEHLSYQLLAELPEWEGDTDTMLVVLPIVGCAFRKVYYDPSLGRNTTRLVTADRFVVNYRARSLEDCPRVTEEMQLYPYEIQERIRSKRFIEFDYADSSDQTDAPQSEKPDAQDDDAPHLFLEQHRLLDLDEDGYPEPYIVTVHHASQKVCRIVANFSEESVNFAEDGKVAAIRKQQYYVKYQFLPSPDGGFYGWGFGWLLKDISEAINTTMNEMLDAGHLANMQGGLVSSQLGIREKKITLAPGEWRVINTSAPISQAVMPISYPGPSQTLFNLLGLLVEAGKDVAAIKDVLTGEGLGANASPTTTMALIEQGLQVFTSIYKRIHRALKAELGIHARLNRKHVDPQKYAEFFDQDEQQQPGPNGMPMQLPTPEQDYNEGDMDILPISDPTSVSKMQKLAKAEFVWQTSQGNPMVNPHEALRRMYEAADVEEIDKLLLPPPKPDPEVELLLKADAILEVENKEMDITVKEAGVMKTLSEIEQGQAQTQAGIEQGQAGIEQQQASGDMARSKLLLDTLKAEGEAERAQDQQAHQQKMAEQEMMANGQGGVPGMAGQPGNPMGAATAGGQGAGAGGGGAGLSVPLDGPGADPMGQPASAGGL
jgi:chaperonin GroES